MRRPQLLFIWAICLFLSGCSSLKIGYYFADDLIIEQADDFLSFEFSEKSEAHGHMKDLMAWHRAEMLPHYAAFLEAQADIAQKGVWTRAQIAQSFADYRGLLEKTIAGAAPFAAQMLVIHSDEEKLAYLNTNLMTALQERWDHEREETPQESLDEWVERQVRNLERFVGDLNEAQIAEIENLAGRDAFMATKWLESREKRQDAFITFMKTEPSEEEIADFLVTILLRPDELIDGNYQTISEERWQTRRDLYFVILNSLDAAQQETLVASLTEYAGQMREMAAQTVGS